MDINDYSLIGIGEFSYGFQEIWEFRYNLLKKIIRTTNKKIMLFMDVTKKQQQNINRLAYVDEDDKLEKGEDLQFIERKFKNKFHEPIGMLGLYVPYVSESHIVYKILKYIKSHRDRIQVVGIKNIPTKDVCNEIKKLLNTTTHINLLFAHNNIVDDRIKKNYVSCGHYLKKIYGKKYCIILSQASQGELRFDSFYLGHHSDTHVWEHTHFYKFFMFKSKKYNKLDNNYKLCKRYCKKLIEFGNGYYENTKYGHNEILSSHTWDFMLFWNVATKLIYLTDIN